jgi:membrane protease YdiL (CAAX protease family)
MSTTSASTEPAKTTGLSGWPAALVSTLTAIGLYYCLPIAASVVLVAYGSAHNMTGQALQDWFTQSATPQFVYYLLVEGAMVGAILELTKLFGWSWRSIGLIKPRWYHPLVGLAAAVPYYGAFLIVVAIVKIWLPDFGQGQTQQIGFESVTHGWPLVLTFFSLVILPPLAEEITMRGFLYTGLRKWLPRLLAVVVVSALFGAAHLPEGSHGLLWIGALDTFILSLVLVGLREATGNLWAGITLHAFKNLIAFIILFHLFGR